MQFPQQFPSLTIPTGAGPGQQRITINDQQDGKIKVYDASGNLVDAIGGPQGQIILYDTSGNMVVSLASTAGTDAKTGLPFQAGITTYTSNTAINLFGNDGTWTASDGSKIVIESAGGASIFFTPTSTGGPWFAGVVQTATALGVPMLSIASPSDTVNDLSAQLILRGSKTTSTATSASMIADTFAVTGTATFGNFATGSVVITPSAINTPTSSTVSYGPLTGTTFVATTTPVTGVPQNVSTSVGTPSATSMAVRLTRTDNTTATTVYWTVWGS